MLVASHFLMDGESSLSFVRIVMPLTSDNNKSVAYIAGELEQAGMCRDGQGIDLGGAKQ